MVELLLDRQADLEARQALGGTPLLQAVMTGQLEIAMLLIHRRAAIDAQNALGTTALDIAVLFSREPFVRFLLEARATVDLAVGDLEVLALFGGSVSLIPILVRAGSDVNWPFRPPTRLFAKIIRIGALPHLLFGTRNFVSMMFYHALGMTPLMAASLFDNPSVVQHLMLHRADPSIRNSRGRTAKDLTTIFGSPSAAAALTNERPLV